VVQMNGADLFRGESHRHFHAPGASMWRPWHDLSAEV
jgi:hypothetical protein